MTGLAPNWETLHSHEEAVRAQTLETIGADVTLTDKFQAAHDALDYLAALLQAPCTAGTDQHTVQLLTIRAFNTGASAARLGLAGYYQAAFHLLRDCLELANLADLFVVDAAKISAWKNATEKEEWELFRPAAVRKELAKHPQYKDQNRQPLYRIFSRQAVHMTFDSFGLIAPDGSPVPGPFFHPKLLLALLDEMARHLCHVAISFGSLVDSSNNAELARVKQFYIDLIGRYISKYMKPASGSTADDAER